MRLYEAEVSDAWESTKWENLFGNLLPTVIAETKLTENIEDEKGTDLILLRMLVKDALEVDCKNFYALYEKIEAHGHMGSLSGIRVAYFAGKSDKTT